MAHVTPTTISNISEERTVYIFPVKVFLDLSDAEYGRNYMATYGITFTDPGGRAV
jgi:hypothetical protein